MRFSERYGYKPIREKIQKESMDDEPYKIEFGISLIYLFMNQYKISSYRFMNINTSNLKYIINTLLLIFSNNRIDDSY